MEQYLRRSSLASLLNGLGVRVLLMAAGIGWFIWLWGAGLPSLLAGTALGVLLNLAVSALRGRAADNREEAARRQLGGELVLEQMLMLPDEQAHLLAAKLLAQRDPLQIGQANQEGVVCTLGTERLLVACVARPADCEADSRDAALLQRACALRRCDRGVLCLTCREGKGLIPAAEDGPIPVRVIGRGRMLALAGIAAPATDEQLRTLKQRRQRRRAAVSFRRMLLHPDKARRYMGYGLGLMLMYILTGLRYYPIPGAICMGLAALCRCEPTAGERL